ncbi:MAG: hypothetical protein RI900_1832 [Actinomycetota bacterium]
MTSVVAPSGAAKPNAYDRSVISHHRIGSTEWIDVVDPLTSELDDLARQRHLDERIFDEAHRRAARPTMQRAHDHVYVVAFSGTLAEVDMWAGDGWFATVRRHDEEGREWEPTVALARGQRLAATEGGMTSGMMLALTLEDLVEGYFDSLDHLEDRIELIEDRIFGDDITERSDPAAAAAMVLKDEHDVQEALFDVRRELLQLRRAVMPLRDVFSSMLRGEVRWIDDDAMVICRDTFDKVLRATDMVDELRELVGNAVEAHLAVMSNQMNLVMKQLTAWGSIVFGATLIAGIYGMNFDRMPELHWAFGYPFALGLMVVMSGGLYWLFKRRKWL